MAEGTVKVVRHGVVAVVVENRRWLVIRRSQCVVAPGKYCFPGGGIETAETEEQALFERFARNWVPRCGRCGGFGRA